MMDAGGTGGALLHVGESALASLLVRLYRGEQLFAFLVLGLLLQLRRVRRLLRVRAR